MNRVSALLIPCCVLLGVLGCLTTEPLRELPTVNSPSDLLRRELAMAIDSDTRHDFQWYCLPADLQSRPVLLETLLRVQPLIKSKQYREAVTELSMAAMVTDNDQRDLQLVRGILYASIQDAENATREFDAVIATGTADQKCRALFHRAMLSETMGRPNEAKEDRDAVKAACPGMWIREFPSRHEGGVI